MDQLYFFGRFNFPHYGYLYVISEALRQLQPTKGVTIIFSHEQATWGKIALSLAHRKAMFALALKELTVALQSQVHFSSIEYLLEKKMGSAYGGYTIDALRELLRNDIGSSGILLGADALIGIPGIQKGFTAWKDWEEIQRLASIVTIPRGRYANATEVSANLPIGVHPIILNTQPSELQLHASSSAILAGQHIYLPPSVKAYALTHDLLIQ